MNEDAQARGALREQLCVRLTKEQAAFLAARAAEHGRTPSEEVRDWVESYRVMHRIFGDMPNLRTCIADAVAAPQATQCLQVTHHDK